jgi:hypothetical protein
VELRRRIEDARAFHEKANEKERDILSEARRRVLEGSLGTGKQLIENAGIAGPEASRILREAEGRERRAERAMARADEHLQREEIFEALRALDEAVRACGRHEKLPEVLFRAKGAACARIEHALDEGSVDLADDLYGRLRSLAGDSLEIRRFEAPITAAREALEAYAARDYATTQVALERLARILHRAAWVEEARSAVERLVVAQRTIEAGPLGRSWGGGTGTGGLETLVLPRGDAAPAPRPVPVKPVAHEAVAPATSGRRLLLWVDGVGTYLILPADRVTLGRAGSSSTPDIALSGNLSGLRGELVRVEDDYFVVASEGTVRVNGRAFERKLLASGDRIEVGPKCRFDFRIPTPLSATAVLSLHGGTRMEGGARNIILVKEHLIVGQKGKSHVETTGPRIILSFEPRGLVCRAEEEILVQGKPAGREAMVPLGTQVDVGGVGFALTDAMGGRD